MRADAVLTHTYPRVHVRVCVYTVNPQKKKKRRTAVAIINSESKTRLICGRVLSTSHVSITSVLVALRMDKRERETQSSYRGEGESSFNPVVAAPLLRQLSPPCFTSPHPSPVSGGAGQPLMGSVRPPRRSSPRCSQAGDEGSEQTTPKTGEVRKEARTSYSVSQCVRAADMYPRLLDEPKNTAVIRTTIITTTSGTRTCAQPNLVGPQSFFFVRHHLHADGDDDDVEPVAVAAVAPAAVSTSDKSVNNPHSFFASRNVFGYFAGSSRCAVQDAKPSALGPT
jgi:hypothetical protein